MDRVLKFCDALCGIQHTPMFVSITNKYMIYSEIPLACVVKSADSTIPEQSLRGSHSLKLMSVACTLSYIQCLRDSHSP